MPEKPTAKLAKIQRRLADDNRRVMSWIDTLPQPSPAGQARLAVEIRPLAEVLTPGAPAERATSRAARADTSQASGSGPLPHTARRLVQHIGVGRPSDDATGAWAPPTR